MSTATRYHSAKEDISVEVGIKIIPGVSSEYDEALSLDRPVAPISCRAVSLLIDTEPTRGDRGAVWVHLF